MKVIVSSLNPVKIQATKNGFLAYFSRDEITIMPIFVPSGVSNQPKGNRETLRGAKNRVKHAKSIYPNADYWVGIEGGIEKKRNEVNAFAWVYILSKTGKEGKGKSGTYFLPKKLIELINKGHELGKASDIAFNLKNSKHKQGSIGILTKNVIDRTEYYKPAVIFALIPFINADLY